MGCGCRKSIKSSRPHLNSRNRPQLKAFSSKNILSRIKICDKCKYIGKTKVLNKSLTPPQKIKIKRCTKTGKVIDFITQNPSFHCPLGRF